MSCSRFEERLAALVGDEIDPEHRAETLEHLHQCEACRRSFALLTTAWEALDDAVPSPPPVSVRARSGVQRMILAAETSDATRAGAPRRAPWWARLGIPAIAVAALVIGIVVGRRLASTDDPVAAVLASRVDALEQAMLVEQLRSEDAIIRLSAVEATFTFRSTDSAIVEALLRTLAEDPSVNVRLAAVEALMPVLEDPGVAVRVAQILSDDASALVQIALIERLGAIEDPSLRTAVTREVDPRGLQPDARKRYEILLGGTT